MEGELKGLMKRVKLENVFSYLMYERDSVENIIEDYDQILEMALNTILNELRKICPDDERMFNIVMDFAEVHDNVFFQVGMLAGIQLYKSIDRKVEQHSDRDIQKVMEKVQGGQAVWNTLFKNRF